MAEYFLCLDAETFARRIRPALAESWARRRFDPCRALCAELLPAALDYTRRYHTGEEQPLVGRVADGLPFDRDRWRLLVAEVLLFAADEIPQIQTNAETLCLLLAPGWSPQAETPRGEWPPVVRALRGGRELTFGAAAYRPDHAGYNDETDVARLAAYLSAVRPQDWTPEDLRGLPGADDEERADELEFVREWFPALADLYRRSEAGRRVLVIENIY